MLDRTKKGDWRNEQYQEREELEKRWGVFGQRGEMVNFHGKKLMSSKAMNFATSEVISNKTFAALSNKNGQNRTDSEKGIEGEEYRMNTYNKDTEEWKEARRKANDTRGELRVQFG